MTKKELIQSLWICAKDRLPDPDVHKQILTYNKHSKQFNYPLQVTVRGIVKYMKDFWEGKVTRPGATARGTVNYSMLEITHWMPLHGPDPQQEESRQSRRRS